MKIKNKKNKLNNFLKSPISIIVLIIVLGTAIRIASVDYPLINDESIWTYIVEWNPYVNWIGHPPVYVFFLRAFHFLFGIGDVSLRILSVSFYVINSCLLYLIAKRYGKKAAAFSLGVYAFSFWTFLSGMMIDQDNTILTALFLACVYFFLKYNDTKKTKYKILAGVMFGVALLSKLAGVLIIATLGIYFIFRFFFVIKRNFKKAFAEGLDIAIIALIGIGMFGLYALAMKVWLPSWLSLMLGRATPNGSTIKFTYLFYFAIWGTSLLIGLIMCSVIINIKAKEIYLYISWIFATLLAYTFIGTSYVASFDRYLMIMLPAVAILGGIAIEKMNLKKSHWIVFVVMIVIMGTAVVWLNVTTNYVEHSFADYFSMLKSFNWHFFLPITGGSGPAIGIDFLSLALGYIIGIPLVLISALLYYYKGRNRKLKEIGKYCFALFLAVSFSVNAFMIEEYAVGLVHPNIGEAMKDTMQYIKENNVSGPFYTNSDGMKQYYIPSLINGEVHMERYIPREMDNNEASSMLNAIKKENGKIIFLNYPKVKSDNKIWQILAKCDKIKSFEPTSCSIGNQKDYGSIITIYSC